MIDTGVAYGVGNDRAARTFDGRSFGRELASTLAAWEMRRMHGYGGQRPALRCGEYKDMRDGDLL